MIRSLRHGTGKGCRLITWEFLRNNVVRSTMNCMNATAAKNGLSRITKKVSSIPASVHPGNCDLKLILDGKYGHGKDGRSRGEHRGNTLRRPHNRSEDQSDAKTSPDVPRGRGRVRGPSSTNHKSLDHAHSKQGASPTFHCPSI